MTPRHTPLLALTALVAALAVQACGSDKAAQSGDAAPAAAAAPAPGLDKIARAEFNRKAAELALPVFWRTDANQNLSLIHI